MNFNIQGRGTDTILNSGKLFIKRMFHVTSMSAAACLLVIGCDKTNKTTGPERESQVIPEFTATINDNNTRTTLKDHNVIWSEGDKVAIFLNSDKAVEYKVKEGCGGNVTTTLVPVDSKYESGRPLAGKEANIALYPYDYVQWCSRDNERFCVSINIPDKQTYTPETFGCGSMPMVAVSSSKDDTKLSFKNIYGVLKFRMKMDNVTVRSIEVSGNSNEKIAGSATFVYCSYDEDPSMEIMDAKYKLTLDCGNGVEVNSAEGVEFYIPVPPCTFTKGITVRFVTTGNDIVRRITDELTIKRSTILSMPDVTSTPGFNNGNGTEELGEEKDYPYSWSY